MSWLHSALLILTQILTEFIPVSSSSHLMIIQKILGLNPKDFSFFIVTLQGLTTLFIPILFWKHYRQILNRRWWSAWRKGSFYPWFMGLGGVPFMIGGWFAKSWAPALFQPTWMLIGLIIGTGFLLGDLKKNPTPSSGFWSTSPKTLITLACVQTLALIPGVSRLGVTWGLGRWLGLSRQNALTISYILGFPSLLTATSYQLLFASDQITLPPLFWTHLFWVPWIGLYLAQFCLRFIEQKGVRVFILYRIILIILFAIHFFSS